MAAGGKPAQADVHEIPRGLSQSLRQSAARGDALTRIVAHGSLDRRLENLPTPCARRFEAHPAAGRPLPAKTAGKKKPATGAGFFFKGRINYLILASL